MLLAFFPSRQRSVFPFIYQYFFVEIFRIYAPNGISVSSFRIKSTADARSGEPILGPYILPSGFHAPFTVFQSIEEYFRWFISVKKTLAAVGNTKPDLDEAQVTLKRLENLFLGPSLATTLHF